MIVLSAHTCVGSTDSATEAAVSSSMDAQPRHTEREALNTILLTSPRSPSMRLFK